MSSPDTTASLSKITINGITYVPEGSGQTLPSGNRNVLVIDGGWIYAGDMSYDESTKEYTLSNAVWVFRWESVGFDGVLKDPKNKNVTIKKMDHCPVIPERSLIYRVPVEANWGL